MKHLAVLIALFLTDMISAQTKILTFGDVNVEIHSKMGYSSEIIDLDTKASTSASYNIIVIKNVYRGPQNKPQ